MKRQAIPSPDSTGIPESADVDQLRQITSTLVDHPAKAIEPAGRPRAAVAIVLQKKPGGLHALLIERSANEHDYWSGQIALPGGRIEPSDPGPQHTAERETMEELGLDLSVARFLGRLDDIAPEGLNIVVSCFVYTMAHEPVLHPDPREVADAFWFPLAELDDPAGRSQVRFVFQGRRRRYPAVSIRGCKERQLWGITYCLLHQLKKAVGTVSGQ